MSEPLIVVSDGRLMGEVTQKGGRNFVLRYEEGWATSDGFPLSLSLPLGRRAHDGPEVEAFLWGLLPDNDAVLESWGRTFHVSPRNPFALLKNVGEDCAGAVQFVRPERLNEVVGAGPGSVEWLDTSAIAARLRLLRRDPASTRRGADRGQFSLAGAQTKTALLRWKGRWGVPAGRTPTTHILKPTNDTIEGHLENEHFCLELAQRLGLRAARSKIELFEDQCALIIERYDRRVESEEGDLPEVRRVHQEDLCQAVGLPPHRKYQSDGGPTPDQLAQLIRRNSNRGSEDLGRFLDALAFNWLIAGTDAHAKNYSILHAPGRRLRLAPLYDLASFLPYDEDPQRTRLAMKIGGEYRLRDIGKPQWEKLADSFGLDTAKVLRRVDELAALLVPEAEHVRDTFPLRDPDHEGARRFIARLFSQLVARVAECRRRLG
ncbi:MAG: type II toxin-antitoxin system HipA family toxin [Planctomycetota bacterium]